jgi:hypothetical protein
MRTLARGISFTQRRIRLMQGRAYDDYHVGIKEAIKIDPKTFFGYVDLKKKRVEFPSVMMTTSANFLLIL